MKVLWKYFFSHHISFFFFPSFFLLHTRTLNFFSLFPSFLFFPATSSTHVPLLFFLFFLISSFSLPLHTPLQNIPHTSNPSLIPQSLCISLFFFFDSSKANDDEDEDEDDDDEEVSAYLHLFFRLFSLFPYFLFPSNRKQSST